jgi:hypothetical protein
MHRRTVLGLSCAFLAAPLLARAHAKKVYRLGWLNTSESEAVMQRLLVLVRADRVIE